MIIFIIILWNEYESLSVNFNLKKLFINKKKKIDFRLSNNNNFIFTNNFCFSSLDYIENNLESLHNKIYIGENILDFMLYINYIFFINFFNF
jgi:hypothetical protein